MIAGLTGGIGCGKSTVLEIFSGLGWGIFNADGICRSLYESHDPQIIAALSGRWGELVMDGEGGIDRAAVADIVFSAPSELAWLNSIFHPRVLEKLRETLCRGEAEFVMCDVPLLYEAGWEKDFGGVVAVWTDRESQMRRLLERGWNREEIERRLANQLSAEYKLEQADFGIINVFSKQILYKQCQEIDAKLRKNYAKKKI